MHSQAPFRWCDGGVPFFAHQDPEAACKQLLKVLEWPLHVGNHFSAGEKLSSHPWRLFEQLVVLWCESHDAYSQTRSGLFLVEHKRISLPQLKAFRRSGEDNILYSVATETTQPSHQRRITQPDPPSQDGRVGGHNSLANLGCDSISGYLVWF